jgi:hypothetical protein
MPKPSELNEGLRAERIDGVVRLGAWRCQLGHPHGLAEAYCPDVCRMLMEEGGKDE